MMHRKFFSVNIPIILTVASIICHIDLKSLGITGFGVCGHNFIIIVRSPHPKFDVQKDLVDFWKFEIRFVVLFLVIGGSFDASQTENMNRVWGEF
jgi:hypothetical protein